MEDQESQMKPPSRNTVKSRAWLGTWNNYPKNWKFVISASGAKHFEAQLEKAPSTGKLHVQWALYFAERKSRKQICEILPGTWCEAAKNVAAVFNYCQKDATSEGERVTSKKPVCDDPLEDVKLYNWQAEVLNVLDTKAPDSRTIYWLWEPNGNRGKTALAKHICLNYNALYVEGKASDVKCAIASMKQKPSVVIMGLTRSMEDYVSYTALENVKDGIFFSGKYESGMVMYNPPHVLVFANFPPDESKLSTDRWVITELD